MMRTAPFALAWLICASFAPGVEARTFYPMITKIAPAAVRTGEATVCEITAEHGWHAPSAVFVTGKGVTGEVVPLELKAGEQPPAPGGDLVRVRFTTTADAVPGIRDIRLMTARGPSTLGQIVVVRSPLIREAEGNNTLAQAQPITLPATVCGGIEANEDVDVYRFSATANSELVFQMHCQRLLQKLGPVAYHSDPMMTLRNAAGTVVAANDNFFGSDPFLYFRFETAGDYFLEVRDVRYVGYRHWAYALEIHSRPLALQALQAVVSPGVTTSVRLVGHQLPAESSISLSFPSDAPEGLHWVSAGLIGGEPVDPLLPAYVTRHTILSELAMPNDTLETAQAITAPVGIAGVIEQPDDVDCYAFEAQQGDRLTFAVVARAVHSPLDACLRILDEKGAVLIENDDASDKTGNSDCRNEITYPDPRIVDWTVPAAGRFVVEIRDTHLRGGERYTYFLEARPRQPSFYLELDTDKTILAPGVTSPLFVRAFRKEGFAGPISLTIDGLPPGVTAVCGEIPADGQDACVFLTAADDAPPGGFANIRVSGTASLDEDGGRTLTATAQPFQELRRDGGARYMVPVETHAVGVAAVLDLKHVRSSETTLALKPGETRAVKVSFERSPGFKEPVTLTGIHMQHVWVFGRCLPGSVSVDERASKLRVTGDEVEGTIVLKVAPDAKPAPPRLVPLMANVSVNFSLKMMYCGEPVLLSVEVPSISSR